ncbi:DUF2799 domain-containing protein [Psychrobacter urativorans]|uniref:DUF2799 domain-containing protein n=1 Tax=Psychrobacter urativorans TaxID=45610 RepID=A0A0M4TEH1_9GAMM|nr:DUF2799 domain-containing protein [Psychrobacter urativorans]ALF59441.1 hypothetical protein AOC03_04705 [Psychrobacter urativorans]
MRSFVQVLALRLPLLGSIVLLAGCATLSKEECTVGNWQTIGYNDGVAGYYSDRLAAHAKACAKVGTAPDYQTWERGRQQGLQQYCTTSNAYNIGKRGRDLNSVCPAALANALQQANQQGQRYYNLNKQLTEDKLLLEKHQAEYIKLRDGEMLDFNTEKEARARLLSLPPELQRIRYRIATTEAKLTLENQKTHF